MERTTIDIGTWLNSARQELCWTENPGLEAQILLGNSINLTRVALLTHPERLLTPDQIRDADVQLQRRLNREPLPYILGRWEFFGLSIRVTPDVLIPRPETELMVETALEWLNSHKSCQHVVDVGTGSGAIGIALLSRLPYLRLVAVDLSSAALKVARSNFVTHGVLTRADLVQCDLLTAFIGPFDLVCANLPYIPTRTLGGLGVAKAEPLLALDGGPDGLRPITRLLADAQRWLSPGGCLLLEIEASQGESAANLARRFFPTAQVTLILDLAGLPRLVKLEMSYQ